MIALRQLLFALLGGLIGVAVAFSLSRRSRRQLFRACGAVFAVAFALPIYSHVLHEPNLFVLPLLGGGLAYVGAVLGGLIERSLRRRQQDKQ